jgi:hypothetical protein
MTFNVSFSLSKGVEPVEGRTIPVRILRMQDVDRDSPATTDVVYDHKGQAHHRTRRDGLRPHDEAHHDRATIVRVRPCLDQVLWIADQPFEVNVERRSVPDDPHSDAVPGSPFEWQKRRCGGSKLVASGTPREDAPHGLYKVTFMLADGTVVDPDLDVGP